MQKKYAHFLLAGLLTLSTAPAFSQSASDEIAKYREMIAEGNPAELYEM
ncbi:MAG: sulfur oxidation c-type cytochrome SoxA, partial [Alcaligenaceae bacterium]|nr:sulfur oxidation c-type cytochrome SoxA [Alcaligenaceae bacterium]